MFQSTPPCGGEPSRLTTPLPGPPSFNPRPRVGANPDTNADWSMYCHRFQSTPPCGGEPSRLTTPPPGQAFQSTPPCGGERWKSWHLARPPEFQSTPPCGGEPGSDVCSIAVVTVSIHAPVWGRTALSGSELASAKGFNPRPRVGANHGTSTPRMLHGSFNPRPRVGANSLPGFDYQFAGGFQSTPPCGGEQCPRPINQLDRPVSIHAPVWGRTALTTSPLEKPPCFNPRPRVGANHASNVAWSNALGVSIHAPVWGRTTNPHPLATRTTSFNPRPRVGANAAGVARGGTRPSFNPRPRVGANYRPTPTRNSHNDVSIHAPVWGRTR